MDIDASQISLSRLIDRFFNAEVIGDWIGQMPDAIMYTLLLALVGAACGSVLGLIIALGSISKWMPIRAVSRSYIEAFRGTSLLVQILFIYFGFPLIGIRFDPIVAGMLALSLNSAAYVAEIFRAGIESIDRGQVEAARSIGMPLSMTMRVVVVPQAFRRVIPPLTNEFVSIIKDSALVSVIGVTEVLRVAQTATGATFNASMYTVAALTYLSMTVPLGALARRLERRFGSKGSQSWLEAERSRRKAMRRPLTMPSAHSASGGR